MHIRDERPADLVAIGQVITQAMRLLEYSTGTEAAIVERLRAASGLTLSLVAEEQETVIGYLATSQAHVADQGGWALIGPLAVLPSWHRQKIGTALMLAALQRLRSTSRGAALVGDPAYYSRFGFHPFPGLQVRGCPPEVVLALPFDGSVPCGELIHHPAFGLTQSAS